MGKKHDPRSRNLYSPSDDCSVDQSFEGDYHYDKEKDKLVTLIKPVPRLFTDYYRWFLYKNETAPETSFHVGMGIPIDECSKSCSNSFVSHTDTVDMSMYTHGS